MLYRLLEKIPADHYCLISRQDYESPPGSAYSTHKLPAPYYCLQLLSPAGKSVYEKLAALNGHMEIITNSFFRAGQISRILEKEDAKILIVCTGDLIDVLSAYLVSLRSDVKLVTWMFDWFLYQWTALHRRFSRFFEPLIVRKSREVIVPNENLHHELQNRYRKKSVILRNPCLIPGLEELDRHPPLFAPDSINIVYTGAVYDAQAGALRNLAAALQMIDGYPLQLHIYSSQPGEVFQQEKIQGARIHLHAHTDQTESALAQRQADMLFLPLAFDSPMPEVIRTSAPGKMGDYLASGKPILAHVPRDSFVKWYLDKYRCGVVADEDDPRNLAETMVKLINDKELRRELGKNARQRAERDYDSEIVRAQFSALLENMR